MAKVKSVLGKGKAGEVAEAVKAVRIFMMIKAEDLELGPNVRGKITDEKRKRFAENIRANRIDTPLVVEQAIGGVKSKYIIRDGACRFLGGQDAGLKEFPCQVRVIGRVEDVATFQLRTTFREDFGAVEEAKAFRDQLKNKTLADLVLATGKEKVYIEKRLLLLNLDAEMQQAITDGKISAGHGYVLAQVGNPASRKKLFGDTCRSKASISSLISDIRQGETAWLNHAKFDKAECKKCPFSNLDAPDMFTQGDADDIKGLCTKPECFNLKQLATLKEEAKKYPGCTVKITTEPSYHYRDKFPELRSARELAGYGIKELGPAWKNKCLKCKSLLVILGSSAPPEFHCTNPTCLRNLQPKEKGSSSGENEMSGGGDFTERQAGKRTHFTRNDFLTKEIVKNTNEISSLVIAVWSLVDALGMNALTECVPKFLVAQKLIKTEKDVKRKYWKASEFLLEYLVKFNKDMLLAALKFFSAQVVEENNPFAIPELVEVARLTSRYLDDFRVTEDYLNSMTKDELVKLAGEFNLTLPKLEKKGELVKFILDAKPGKAPAEITKEDYRENEEE